MAGQLVRVLDFGEPRGLIKCQRGAESSALSALKGPMSIPKPEASHRCPQSCPVSAPAKLAALYNQQNSPAPSLTPQPNKYTDPVSPGEHAAAMAEQIVMRGCCGEAFQSARSENQGPPGFTGTVPVPQQAIPPAPREGLTQAG